MATASSIQKALFLHLLTMLSMSALQQLGKLQNPLTGKTEVQLDLAQATIDMLDMLEAKTRGNRDADEDKALKDTLTMLKMNYVETAASQRTEENSEKSAAPAAAGSGAESAGAKRDDAPANEPDQSEPKDPKFHKTYS
jgi:hypothetical protein